MPIANFDGLNFYYEIRGSGPRLLYIGGTAGDLRRAPNAFTTGYHDHFETLGYDQRGMGQTDKPDISYSMEQYADDAARLLDAVGWDDCSVVGYSFGGMVAQEFAVRHPARARKLVIAGAAAGGAGGSSFPMEQFQGMAQDEMLRLRIATSDLRHDADWQKKNPDEFSLLYDQALVATQFAADAPGRDVGSRRQLEARAKHDAYDRLPELKMPVLVCGGVYDGIAPVNAVRAMAANIANAELALFEDGHLFLHNDPAAGKNVMEFLQD